MTSIAYGLVDAQMHLYELDYTITLLRNTIVVNGNGEMAESLQTFEAAPGEPGWLNDIELDGAESDIDDSDPDSMSVTVVDSPAYFQTSDMAAVTENIRQLVDENLELSRECRRYLEEEWLTTQELLGV